MKALARWSVRTPVAANMMMALILIGGFFALMSMRREFFPEFSLDMVTVTVPYPGASPSEVEEAICIRVEEAIEGLEGIKEITSTAIEGAGTVLTELEEGVDSQKVYDDIRNAIDQIDTFPDDAKEPVIEKLSIQRQAIFVAVYGSADERSLRHIAEDLRDAITATDEVSIARIEGARDYEISVQVSEENLRRYGLTFDQVSAAVAGGSVDLPGGQIRAPGGDILVRAKGRQYTGRGYADIPLLSRPDGTVLRVGDVATVRDGFEDTDRLTLFDGQPAVAIEVRQTSSQDIIEVVDRTKEVVKEFGSRLPKGVDVATVFDASVLVRDRIDLLLRNGAQGFVLVFLSLWLFLRWRLAFWVAAGIPISFMGGFIILHALGGTINMLSLFAFIMTLGIVVDDAIIVGENIHAHLRQGESPYRAAMNGAAEVGWPVVISVLTTIVAFTPLLFVTGIMGKFISVIPTAVIATLAVSLLEAFLILPAHLKHSLEASQARGEDMGPGTRSRVIHAVIERIYIPFAVRPALRWRYLTVAIAFAAVIVSIGMVAGGRLPFIVFPKFDSNYILATIQFPQGTPVETTTAAIHRMENGLDKVMDENAHRVRKGVTADDLRIGVLSFVGAISPQGSVPGVTGANVGQVLVEILPTEQRTITSDEILDLWRKATGEIPGVEQMAFSGGQAGPGGSPIEIRLLGRDLAHLEAAAEELKHKLATYAGVYDISDNFQPGKWEYKVRAKPIARALGITLGDIARQMRQAYYGDEAVEIQRGREDLKVRVQYTEAERRTRASFQNMRIRTAAGKEIPLEEIAAVDFGRGYAAIRRARRLRAISVTADLDETKANAQEIVSELVYGKSSERGGKSPVAMILGKLRGKKQNQPQGFLPQLVRRHPGIQYDLEGQARNTRESVGSLMTGFAYALIGIFCLLAAQFRSYIQPVVVMCAIPVSLVGAFGGHLIMGKPLTMISLFGIVALAGIVVNDSLVLIDFINRRVQGGMTPLEAAIDGGRARFRAILLTSITTVAGLAPLLLEDSMQAQFLIPMAISIAFGLMAATVLTLVITPSLYLIVADVKALLGMPMSEPVEDDDDTPVPRPAVTPQAAESE